MAAGPALHRARRDYRVLMKPDSAARATRMVGAVGALRALGTFRPAWTFRAVDLGHMLGLAWTIDAMHLGQLDLFHMRVRVSVRGGAADRLRRTHHVAQLETVGLGDLPPTLAGGAPGQYAIQIDAGAIS